MSTWADRIWTRRCQECLDLDRGVVKSESARRRVAPGKAIILTFVDESGYVRLGHEKMTTHGSDTMLDEGRQDLLP